MALPTAAPATEASPQLIGNSFVQQYYLFLHQSPEQIHKFYLDSSILCHPDRNGVMTSVTTIQAINEKILSLDFRNYFVEIETVDTQLSFKNAILIVVTGSITSKENIRRKFTQSFFLAPQEKGGYFVQNDIFRYFNRTESDDIFNMFVNGSIDNDTAKVSLVNGANDNDAPEATLSNDANDNVGPKAPISTDTESSSLDLLQTTSTDVDADNNELLNPSENGGSGVMDDASVHPLLASGKDANFVPETMPTTEDGVAKKSYASIVKVVKGNPSNPPVYVPVTKSKMVLTKQETAVTMSSTPPHASENSTPNNDIRLENQIHEGKGHSVYIRNLPLDTTPEQVEEEFKKFGNIRQGGVQVRNKVEHFCFGFVEFESLKSMEAAIEASPVMFRGRQAYVEVKKTTKRVVNGVVINGNNGNDGNNGSGARGRFQLERGGFRNDNYRGRNFGANMGYMRNDLKNRGELSGRGRAPTRGTSGYQQKVFQNGNGDTSGPKQVVATA